jgi:hypothetical protein
MLPSAPTLPLAAPRRFRAAPSSVPMVEKAQQLPHMPWPLTVLNTPT